MITLSEQYWVLGEQRLGPLERYFAKALRKAGKKVSYISIYDLYPDYISKLSGYFYRFPRKLGNAAERKFLNYINSIIVKKYKEEKPSNIIIYNDCRILPNTLEFFKKSGSKITVLLGDDPNYYIHGKKYFLFTVMHADSVISTDTGWIDGLRLVGVKNIIYSPLGTDPETFFPMTPSNDDRKKYGCDVLFVGKGYYLNGNGIRRTTILNELTDFNMKIFGGNDWKDLFYHFPDLKKHHVQGWLNADKVNIACNCAKLYPVLMQAGVRNGVSTRVYDCTASGIFIISEYKKDIETLFPNGEIVTFKSKYELKDLVKYFLTHEDEMKDRVKKARELVLSKYTIERSVKEILNQIE